MVYADLKCLLEKMHSCQNNFEKFYTEKKKLSICLLVTHCLQVVGLTQKKENKLGCYRYKDCIKRLCNNLKEHATRITNYEKKKKDSTDRWIK